MANKKTSYGMTDLGYDRRSGTYKKENSKFKPKNTSTKAPSRSKSNKSLDATKRSYNLGAPVLGGRNKRNRAAVKAAGMD